MITSDDGRGGGSGVSGSGAEQPAAEQRAAEQRAAEQRAAEQRAAEQRAAEQRAAEQHGAEQHGAEQHGAEQHGAGKEDVAVIFVSGTSYSVARKLLCNDSPNWFTEHGCDSRGNSAVRVDRDAHVFSRVVLRHLAGYSVTVCDEQQYAETYYEALFFGLTRLVSSLNGLPEYFVNVGGRSFRVTRALVDVPGQEDHYLRRRLAEFHTQIRARLRSGSPGVACYPLASVPRSDALFAELLALLRDSSRLATLGAEKRALLRAECEFFGFRVLSQALVNATVVRNPALRAEEIIIPLAQVEPAALRLRGCATMNNTVFDCLQRQHFSENENASAGTPQAPPQVPPQVPQPPPGVLATPCCKRARLNDGTTSITDSGSTAAGFLCERHAVRKRLKYWNMLEYSRPHIDLESGVRVYRDLIFQIEVPGCSVVFNKDCCTTHVQLSGRASQLFLHTFSDVLRQTPGGLDLKRHILPQKASPSAPQECPQSGQVVADPSLCEHNSGELVMPACVQLCDFKVNGHKCNNIFSLVGDSKCNEMVMDYTTSVPEHPNYSTGLKLKLIKSLWKFGIRDGKLMCVVLKADAITGIKEFYKSIDFI